MDFLRKVLLTGCGILALMISGGCGGAAAVLGTNPYGDQGGEGTLAADAATLDTPLRRGKHDPWLQIQQGSCRPESRGPGIGPFVTSTHERQVLCIAYHTDKEIVFAEYPRCEFVVVVKNDRGERHEFISNPRAGIGMGYPGRPPSLSRLSSLLRNGRSTGIGLAGEWSLVEDFFGQSTKTSNMEVYVEMVDYSRGEPAARFKISNSVTIGTIPQITKARNWTTEETTRFSQPRPQPEPVAKPDSDAKEKPQPNASPRRLPASPGEQDSLEIGGAGGRPFRQVRPGQHLLGFIHRDGKWNNQDCIGGVSAQWSAKDATFGQTRTFAKSGYAVGGLNLEAEQYVTAMQVVFMRIKDDGSLDPADQYTSDWIGFPKGEKVKSVLSEGQKVTGFFGRRQVVMDAMGLVMEAEAAKP
ncbi:hypothetical protein GC163_06815 [bacterium]|nr:hypothetical protein [bacterium]